MLSDLALCQHQMQSSNLAACDGIQGRLDPGVTDLQSGVSAGKVSGQI